MPCEYCGALLAQGLRRGTRWCDEKCRRRWQYRVPSRPFSCPACSRTVLVPSDKFSRRKFCSVRCANAYMSGPRNGNWRGGQALSYGPGWREIKEQVRARDGVCRNCGKAPKQNGRALDVHHLRPYRFSGDNSPENLVALCRSCHMQADDHGRRGHARHTRISYADEKRPPSQRELRRRRGKQAKARRRKLTRKAWKLHRRDMSLRQIARKLGVSHQTVANWLKAGRAYRNPVSGPPPR